ncbi:MAG: sensor histidine kinase [Bacteroidota bacterium]
MAILKIRSFWGRQIRDIIGLGLIGIPFGYLVCPGCREDFELLKYAIFISATLWITLSKGNGLVDYVISLYFSWLKEPVKRLITSLIGHTAYTVLMVLALQYTFKEFLELDIGDTATVIIISVGISLSITFIMHSRRFLKSWRHLAVESERIKKEAISAKYEALKNQVNPHFLFNSLNALTNLVYEDADLSAKFIKKLSEVYRYVLETREKETVSLKHELEFVQSFIFLQKIRHEDSLVFVIEEMEMADLQVVPLSIQMLAENALKHNVVSEDEPLIIRIYKDQEFIAVENNLQKKNILKEESSGVGLENIKARYHMLSSGEVEIKEENHLFTVKLPLI